MRAVKAAKQVRLLGAGEAENPTAGAKAPTQLAFCSARLNACPDTKQVWSTLIFFRKYLQELRGVQLQVKRQFELVKKHVVLAVVAYRIEPLAGANLSL